MTNTENITGEVVETATVENLNQGVQLTKIDLGGDSETDQFGKPGTYKLVRVTDDE